MVKKRKNTEGVVQEDHKSRKPEKLGLVGYFPVRRHSRVLYLPLDPTAVRLHDIQKGDIVKARIIEVIKLPRPNELLRESRTKWEEED